MWSIGSEASSGLFTNKVYDVTGLPATTVPGISAWHSFVAGILSVDFDSVPSAQSGIRRSISNGPFLQDSTRSEAA